MKVAYDLRAFRGQDVGMVLGRFVWPTPYREYLDASNRLLDRLLLIDNRAAPADVILCYGAKLSNIFHDLARLLCITIDAERFREAGVSPELDPGVSPVAAFVHHGGDIAGRPFARLSTPSARLGGVQRVKNTARLFLRDVGRRLGPARNRVDLFGTNDLTEVVSERTIGRRVPMYADLERSPPQPASMPPDLANLAAAMVEEYRNELDAAVSDAPLRQRSFEAATRLVNDHLAEAWRDLLHWRRLLRRWGLGSLSLGGTPKYIGRLVGGLYRAEGRPVRRCAHGGDRAFFFDPGWAITELPCCTQYLTHGAGEAANLRRRFAGGREMLGLGTPVFEAVGIDRRRATVRQRRGRRILYVMSVYVGERAQMHPSFRCVDPIYFEWQHWMLQVLRSRGYEVTLRFHPKLRDPRVEFLAAFADGALEGPLDVAAVDTDCFLFDFAGTVFFDALMAGQPSVLAHHGPRPFDTNAESDVRGACGVVDCSFDAEGRLRANPEDLIAAIEAAAEGRRPGEAFIDKYSRAN